MYCGGCGSIPFWRWLKRNQQFSLSVTCNDYGGEYLYNLQPNNATKCFGEYLCTWFWKGYQMGSVRGLSEVTDEVSNVKNVCAGII